MKHTLVVDETAAGARIDLFIGEKLTLTRSKLKALFETQAIRVDGRRVKKGHTVALGQVVEFEMEVTQGTSELLPDAAAPLNVIHEDDALVFIDKPSKMPSHPLSDGERGTVANALIARYPEMRGVGDDVREAGLCHRLDIETSGVLLAARTREAWLAMREAFSSDSTRRVDKRYLALVCGPLADEGLIDLPLAHAGDHVRPVLDGSGRPAQTRFVVQARRGAYALLEVQLITGVLHQIRAHLAAIGAPIVADARYGGPKDEGLTRFFLHASSLGVEHPSSRQWLEVKCPLPVELEHIVDERIRRGRNQAPVDPELETRENQGAWPSE